VIDLHLHTTASDGRSSPEDLVRDAAAAGLRTIAVTDHDTMAALAAVEAAAAVAGLAVVPGIEITAVLDGRDVHVLGYFLDAKHPRLDAFLAAQRDNRRRRLVEICARLDRLGVPVDPTPLVAGAARERGRAVGRPLVAAALVEAGHARDVADAFARYLAEGQPAFVERVGPPPADVLDLIAGAGGIASIAHPGKLGDDRIVDDLIAAGMPAIEVFHPDHDEAAISRYRTLAASRGLLVTGGSDYHGAGSGRTSGLGRVGLPRPFFEQLAARAAGTPPPS
jgi:3',5'-nucleoside bisphosphate phosphatase